ncbi:MraY family glycosyltransferase [Flavivirga algicola]|uniref:Undecaprenyl/decaprenyl-phosphate alpha-N-acetylglucosaminyl 1-phosphate transferase n=1 Tax=Flavivirga algicola TaxID=2729136 RepID=A0ABX1RYS0_9FLAO|nr:MraY family glycosyltransferase [Flavivirga algicola]NMH87639.1 undecaprenyl/decaprenyl-phosphate alpha-N-acetylglucosaminyl 1-phosphate transferase [Flavivirga algicola]
MQVYIDDLLASENHILWMLIALCLSAFVSYSTYPVIIKVSKLKGLMQEPKSRSSHAIKTPNLGGVGIFMGVISALTFVGSILSYNNLLCLIGAVTLLFFTGLKDDLIEISPIKKLIGQIIASLCIILISDIRIHTFFGVFGIDVLPYFISVIFTLFVFILLINAYNLIDGVDGLAGCVGITISMLFGIFFYYNGNDSMLFISLSLIGALITFLMFNFSKAKKLFMGDTGSMIIGFLLAYQGVSFLRVTHNVELFSAISNPPALVIAIFSFPLMDTLRVFIIRLINGKSPFSADKSHIHHNLLALGFKHWEISLIASTFIFIMARITYGFDGIGLHGSIFSLIVVSGFFSVLPYLFLKIRQTNKGKKGNKSQSINKRPRYAFQFQKIYNSVLNIFISIIIYFST